MKMTGRKMMSLAVAAAMVLTLTPVQANAATKKCKLSAKAVTLTVGQKKTLKLKNYKKLSAKKIRKVKWKSSNASVASVKYKGKYRQKAVITAKQAGTAVVRVTYNGKTYRCKVTVQAAASDQTATTQAATTQATTTQTEQTTTAQTEKQTSNGTSTSGSAQITDDAQADYEQSAQITITDEERDTEGSDAVTMNLSEEATSTKHNIIAEDGTTLVEVTKKNKFTIVKAGTYVLSGGTEDDPLDALIEVELAEDADDTETAQVHLILDGLYLTSSNLNAPDKDKGLITIKQNDSTPQLDNVIITLKAGSANVLADVGTCGVEEEDDTTSSDTTTTSSTTYTGGIVCKKTPLVINGTGSLKITSKNGNGIKSTSTLKIADADITVGTEDVPVGHNGITGKTGLATSDATLCIYAQNDALKTTLDSTDVAEDATLSELGNMDIEGGSYTVYSADGDGISVYRTLLLNPETMSVQTVITGTPDSDGSHKCIKAGTTIDVPETAGNITLDSSGTYSSDRASGDENDSYADDTLHCDGYILIAGGTFDIASGDDGVHADQGLTVTGGSLTITECYEGLEAADITIGQADADVPVIQITARDDGLNAAGGSDTDTTGSSNPGDAFGKGQSAGSTDYQIIINGGTLTIDAEGDGIDSNGNLYITGGDVTVYGPNSGGNGALDYGDGSCVCQVSGGTLTAIGRSDMAVVPTGNGQPVLAITWSSLQTAGTTIAVKDTSGNTVMETTPTKNYNHVVFSSEALTKGQTYSVYVGNTLYQTVTLSATGYNTTVGSGSGNRPGGSQGGSQRR